MKASLVLIIMYVVFALSFPYLSAMTGSVELLTGIGTSHLTRTPAYFYSNAAPYVSGGVTFTYPSGLFTQTPTLLVTFSLLNRAYSTSEIVAAEVVTTTSLQATVRVNVGSTTLIPTISEASTNDVTVYLRAVGM